MDNQNETDDFLEGLKHLVQQYRELNTIILREGPKIVSRLIAKPDKVNTLQRINKDILAPLTAEWVSLSQQHIENLLDLGKTASRRFQHLLEMTDETPTQPAQGVRVVPVTSTKDETAKPAIVLRGKPGTTIGASFNLNAKDQAYTGQFATTPFYHESTGEIPGFMPVFKPLKFSVEPGSSQLIEIAVALPRDLDLATYRSTVVVLGAEQNTFDIVLSVEELPA